MSDASSKDPINNHVHKNKSSVRSLDVEMHASTCWICFSAFTSRSWFQNSTQPHPGVDSKTARNQLCKLIKHVLRLALLPVPSFLDRANSFSAIQRQQYSVGWFGSFFGYQHASRTRTLVTRVILVYTYRIDRPKEFVVFAGSYLILQITTKTIYPAFRY